MLARLAGSPRLAELLKERIGVAEFTVGVADRITDSHADTDRFRPLPTPAVAGSSGLPIRERTSRKVPMIDR